jgi:hypothetical protein
MTHLQFIKSNFNVLAEKDTSILYIAYGEMCAEINGVPFLCKSVEEFWDLVEFFGDEDFAE